MPDITPEYINDLERVAREAKKVLNRTLVPKCGDLCHALQRLEIKHPDIYYSRMTGAQILSDARHHVPVIALPENVIPFRRK